jgi:hypothetical protein
MLGHHALALAGEVGEFCNMVKKIDRGDLVGANETTMHNFHVAMANELVDCLIYICQAATVLNFRLDEGYKQKREYNAERFDPKRRNPNESGVAATSNDAGGSGHVLHLPFNGGSEV